VLLIRSGEEGGRPTVWVSSSAKTTRYPNGNEDERTFETPANTRVLFTWRADASDYGGRITGYSYGIDLESLDEDDPGWAPESPELRQARPIFHESTTTEHTLYVRVRDDAGTVEIAEAILVVIPLTQDRHVLYVDDWGWDVRGREYAEIGPECTAQANGGHVPDDYIIDLAKSPPDTCHDYFLRQSIRLALDDLGLGDWSVDRYEPLEPVSGNALTGRIQIDVSDPDHWVYTGPITLRQLSRYRLVIWNTRSDNDNALKRMNLDGEDNVLAVYLEAGGAAWIMGTGAFSRTIQGNRSVGLSEFGYRPEDFTYRFLKVRSVFENGVCQQGCFRTSGSGDNYELQNGFEGAYAVPPPPAAAGRQPLWVEEGFPATLRVTRAPFANHPLAPRRGVPSCEAMVVPHGLTINPWLEPTGGQLDTLYFYQSNFWLDLDRTPGESWMDLGATALRYAGPDQGPLMMWGMPVFFLPEDEVHDVMVAAIRWLLDH
jgi:hypothetical protein